MISADIRVEGIREVMAILREMPEALDHGMEEAAKTMKGLAEGRTPVASGRAKRSWGQVQKHRGGYSFTNPVWYTEILEEGLYPAVGPRTVAHEGGIYSRQAPGGILGPLVENDEVLLRVAETIVDEIVRLTARAGA